MCKLLQGAEGSSPAIPVCRSLTAAGGEPLCVPLKPTYFSNISRPCWRSPAMTGWGFSMFPPSTGSYFQLNKDSCHPWLTISEDGFTVVRSERKTFRRELPPSKTQFTRYLTGHPMEHSGNLTNATVLYRKLDYGKSMQLLGRDPEKGKTPL